MEQKKGLFIGFEGADGAGKSTQIEIFKQRLEDAGIQNRTLHFPNYESIFGQQIARYLRGEMGTADSVDPYIATTLYAGDRWVSADEIQCALDDGEVVIADRYVSSCLAYQGAKIFDNSKREEFWQWDLHLEYEVYKIPKPEIQIYLHLPLELTQKLLAQKGERAYLSGQNDIHETDLDYAGRVEKAYLFLAETDPTLKRIDCDRGNEIISPEEIADSVYLNIKNYLPVEV